MKTKQKNIKPESVSFDAAGKLDRSRGIVKNVKILGLESRHGYTYSPKAMKEAIPLYEGSRVNVDHPERSKAGASRSYRDRFGSFHNVHFVEGDGLRGNFRFNPKHPIAEQFMWDAENNPESCGFSHNANGPLTERSGRLVCESIDKVRSVDLVADAATTHSLFEGKPKMKIRPKKNTDPRIVRRKLIQSFGREMARELMESLDPAEQAQVATAADAGAGGSSDANVEALLALIKRVLADPNISAEDSIKAVSKRLKALKDMIPGGVAAKAAADPAAGMEGDEDEEDEDDLLEDEDETPAGRKKARVKVRKAAIPAEVAERLERLEAREERISVRELCDASGFKPTEKQMVLLIGADDETREDLIESWQEGAERKPKHKAKSRGLLESDDGGGKSYKDSKEWASGIAG